MMSFNIEDVFIEEPLIFYLELASNNRPLQDDIFNIIEESLNDIFNNRAKFRDVSL